MLFLLKKIYNMQCNNTVYIQHCAQLYQLIKQRICIGIKYYSRLLLAIVVFCQTVLQRTSAYWEAVKTIGPGFKKCSGDGHNFVLYSDPFDPRL